MRLDSVFSSIDSSLLGSAAAGEGEGDGEREGEEGASLKKSPTDFHQVLNEQKIMKSITSSFVTSGDIMCKPTYIPSEVYLRIYLHANMPAGCYDSDQKNNIIHK